jgi:hypothetical protein
VVVLIAVSFRVFLPRVTGDDGGSKVSLLARLLHATSLYAAA